jgi:hypothetical protein
MSEYVSKVLLEVDGQNIDDFESVSEGEVEHRKVVELANTTGSADVTPRYNVSVGYVIPKGRPEFDFKNVKAGTLTIDRMDGIRITFTGVSCLKVGEALYGKEEVIRNIDLMATGRTEK